ncbi:A24 family peptidase [Wenzhouxiangella sp. XN24]|uniref:prepilin peptidase n=1 Tax=Wenzhouxiangella sp. XN24 TaxID=2713569 RepID=UPI0013ECEA2C|nr:prepilin peptidase [Wenzhouxiangella sp. XN24]
MESLATLPPAVLAGIALLFGLLVGSFLNVVVHRLPIMMRAEWRAQCAEEMAQPAPELPEGRFDLVAPRSRCPGCNRPIRAIENVPVFSWLALRGRCAGCKQRISPRYPAVELLTGLMFAATAWLLPWPWTALAGIGLTGTLIALTFIDIDEQLLPDSITLPLLWAGLLFNLFAGEHAFVAIEDALIGAVAGYLALWLVYQGFKLATGREGMGYGDFKLLAALGAWLGWQMLPLVILLSALVGAVVGIAMILLLGRDRQVPIPFGPYLAAAGWIAMIWGPALTGAWLSYAGAG